MKYLQAIITGGLVAATLDIVYAFLVYGARGVGPMSILQSVASCLLGTEAYSGGLQTAMLGGVLHILIAIGMAAAFVAVAHFVLALLRSPVIAGAIYGFGLYFVMNYVVVPLSAAGPGNPPQGWLLVGTLFAHVVLVGIPIALISRRLLTAGPLPA